MKTLEEILELNLLTDFLLGKGEFYLKPDPEIDEPTNYHKSWRQIIIPFLLNSSENDRMEFFQKFALSIVQLSTYEVDINLGIYSLFANLQEYFYFIKSNPKFTHYVDWLPVVEEIREKVDRYRQQLSNDKRWAGVDWNTEEYRYKGILGVIYKTSDTIAERYGQLRILS